MSLPFRNKCNYNKVDKITQLVLFSFYSNLSFNFVSGHLAGISMVRTKEEASWRSQNEQLTIELLDKKQPIKLIIITCRVASTLELTKSLLVIFHYQQQLHWARILQDKTGQKPGQTEGRRGKTGALEEKEYERKQNKNRTVDLRRY